MSGRSTPKRPLEVDDNEDSWREIERLNLKSYQHEINSESISASRSSSRSSYGKALSLDISSDEAKKVPAGVEGGTPEAPPQNWLPLLPGLRSSSASQFLQVPPSSSTVGFGPHRPKARKAEEICFGMLKEVEIKIIANQNRDSEIFDRIRGDEDSIVYLGLIFGKDRCDVQFQGINIATMQTKSQHALQQLIARSKRTIRFRALVPEADFKEKFEAVMQPFGVDKQKLTWSLNIQLFGVRPIADTVAKELCKYHLFLQHPVPMPLDEAYENPQYLTIVGSSFINGAVLPPISVEATHRKLDFDGVTGEPDDSLYELRAVINDLPKQAFLREADVDHRINTDLLIHQKEALDFVIGRESVEKQSPRMLWHIDNLILGGTVFRHKITGLKSQAPDDILGGILADDMGLGKTLTMIAAIVATISHATHFAAGEMSPHQESGLSPIPVMSTLVIVPSVLLLEGWIDEIKKHVAPSALETFIYHGPDRRLASSPSTPLPYHIVFSTYGTVAADFARGGGVLKWFHWYRLILDEAHTVRNWTTKSFKAVTSLSANIRWCMTGTPVQNSLHDLRSLVQFLHVSQFEEPAVFRRHIAERGRTRQDNSRSKPDYENLKLLLGSICLRRNISSLSLGVTFPITRPHLSEAEEQAYKGLQLSCRQSIDAAVSERRVAQGNRAILTALLRLRIFCNTGLASLRVPGKTDTEEFGQDEINSLLQQSGELPVCMECGCDVLSFNANEILGKELLGPRRHFKCPECTQLTTSQDQQRPAHNIDEQSMLLSTEDSGDLSDPDSSRSSPGPFTYPSKLEAVYSDIKKHHSDEKSIVFSFWKRSLDLIAKLLHDRGLLFGQVDGTLSPDRRRKVLADFRQNNSVKVLLMTLGTGAQGINNLSVASRVHILEPQWNPSVEDQAIGRVLRLGQDKKVCVIRYITPNTIEESVQSRQMVKIRLALAGGLQSSDAKKSSDKQATVSLQELNKLVKSTVFTEVLTDVPEVAEIQ